MNGTQYMQHTFTVPVSTSCTQKRWDLAFMTREEFMKKYKYTECEYYKLIGFVRE